MWFFRYLNFRLALADWQAHQEGWCRKGTACRYCAPNTYWGA